MRLQACTPQQHTWPAHPRMARQAACITSALFLTLVVGLCDGAPKPSANDIAAARKARLEYQRSGFNWMSALQYKTMDKTNNTKPYMFTFLSSHCYLCIGLLEHMATKENATWLSNLSAQLNAVLIYDNLGWEHVSPMYTPEGVNYIPRTIFAWPNGTMRTDLMSHNARGEDDRYYYLPRELLYQMWNVLKAHYKATEQHTSDLDDDLAS